MSVFREGKIVDVISRDEDLIRSTVAIDDEILPAVGFPAMLGPLEPGDRVVINTVGIDLELGTGGEAFVLWNLDGPGPAAAAPGHIMKLRYTPWQMPVGAVEAPESPHHDSLTSVTSLDGMPVVVCGLHSQVAAVAAGIRAAAPKARIGYLMTDGAALPLKWSNLVEEMRGADLLDTTCTAGHAFGGELEAVNVFSGLCALKVVGKVDVAIAAMGPGIVGTSTRLGFTGMEQGQVLDAATALQGRSIACLRISFADARSRHQGVSEHSLAALGIAAREPTEVVVPKLPPSERDAIIRQLDDAGICRRHRLVFAAAGPGLDLLSQRGLRPTSMGRSIDEIPEFFGAACAAGAWAGATLV
ncbi:MAG: DUF3866 family protein [Actinomycetota bacterium]